MTPTDVAASTGPVRHVAPIAMATEPDCPATDLPILFSDEELDMRIKERESVTRSDHDRWDNSGLRAPVPKTDGLPESCIEQQFPHIAQKLAVLWPSEACALYLNDLVVNWRGNRQGFPKEVLDDLLMLHEINDMLVRHATRGQRQTAMPGRPANTPHPQRSLGMLRR